MEPLRSFFSGCPVSPIPCVTTFSRHGRRRHRLKGQMGFASHRATLGETVCFHFPVNSRRWRAKTAPTSSQGLSAMSLPLFQCVVRFSVFSRLQCLARAWHRPEGQPAGGRSGIGTPLYRRNHRKGCMGNRAGTRPGPEQGGVCEGMRPNGWAGPDITDRSRRGSFRFGIFVQTFSSQVS